MTFLIGKMDHADDPYSGQKASRLLLLKVISSKITILKCKTSKKILVAMFYPTVLAMAEYPSTSP